MNSTKPQEFIPISYMYNNETFECVQDEINDCFKKGKKPDPQDLAECFVEDWLWRTDYREQRQWMEKPMDELEFYFMTENDMISRTIQILAEKIKEYQEALSTTTYQPSREHLVSGIDSMAYSIRLLLDIWRLKNEAGNFNR